MSEDHYRNRDKMSNQPYEAGGPLGALPLPEMSMPAFQSINPRPFSVDAHPRELTPASVERPPLYLVAGSASDTVQVTPGYVNLEMPTLGGDPLDDDPIPELTITADTWVWLKTVATYGTPDTYVVTVETSASSTPPGSPVISEAGFTSYKLVGKVEWSSPNAEIAQNRDGSDLSVDSYGNTNYWWRV